MVATRPVDFRKGHDGLTAVVQEQLGLGPHSGLIVVFRSKISTSGLTRISELYRIEAGISGRPPGERLAVRQERSAPLVAAFGVWLKQQRARVSAKSRLGEKLGYIARHWKGLQVFPSDGRVEIDSNAVANTIRPLALNRKNALFAGHSEAAGTGAASLRLSRPPSSTASIPALT